MEVVRVLDLRQYDRTVRRFRDSLFKNSSKQANTPDGKGGFSVFEVACACGDAGNLGNPNCICGHISRFYPATGPEPCAYIIFDTNLFDHPAPNPKKLPQPQIIPAVSNTGDDCHRNVHCVSDNRLNKLRKGPQGTTMRLCMNGQSEPFTEDRAIELCNAHYPDPT